MQHSDPILQLYPKATEREEKQFVEALSKKRLDKDVDLRNLKVNWGALDGFLAVNPICSIHFGSHLLGKRAVQCLKTILLGNENDAREGTLRIDFTNACIPEPYMILIDTLLKQTKRSLFIQWKSGGPTYESAIRNQCRRLSANDNIVAMDLSQNNIPRLFDFSPQAVHLYFQQFPHLVHLSLNEIWPVEPAYYVAAIQALQGRLESIALLGNHLHTEHLNILLPPLAKCRELIKVDFSNNCFDDSATSIICRFLQTAKYQWQEIGMSRNPLTEVSLDCAIELTDRCWNVCQIGLSGLLFATTMRSLEKQQTLNRLLLRNAQYMKYRHQRVCARVLERVARRSVDNTRHAERWLVDSIRDISTVVWKFMGFVAPEGIDYLNQRNDHNQH